MIYLSKSLKPVVAKIIRDTRLTDMTYMNDVLDWIAEALLFMEIKWRLEKTYKELIVTNHNAKLPCELAQLNAVQYNGCRLRKGIGTRDVRVKELATSAVLSSYFVHDTAIKTTDLNAQNYIILRGQDINLATSNSAGDFYNLHYNNIQTSFKEGTIIIYYRKRDVDKDGYPMIPDSVNVREAIFWYVCSKLLFTGYKLPLPFTYDQLEEKANTFLARSRGEQTMQSEDDKETMLQMHSSLIPPDNYNTFFEGT